MAGFKVGIGQIAPVWLDKSATLARILDTVSEAADAGCKLVAFGETLLPGYPFWLDRTDGARFNDARQKMLYRLYLEAAVNLPGGDLDPLCELARQRGINVVLGIAEKGMDRGGHSVFCTLVDIDDQGVIRNTHRKLVPTYEERLVWAAGDGHGLRTRQLGDFTLSGLNCWENWLPLARASLYAGGADLHVAIWPGHVRLTQDITRFIAQEMRGFVISASAIMPAEAIPQDYPARELMLADGEDWLADGGSAIAAPDGRWIVEPVAHTSGLITAELDVREVLEARQSLDVVGHYARPDVTELRVNRRRARTATFDD